MTKKAFLVGVNDYAPVGAGGPDLRGCVEDVRDMAYTLNLLSVVPATTTTMRIATDKNATRKAILDGVKWLVTGAKKGDTLIFYYSGHGSYVLDTSGDEADKRDETICPHDYATAGMIKDDDFRAAFAGLAAGVNLDVFLDSCHSGTGTRAPLDTSVTYRFIEPPLDDRFFVEANPRMPTSKLLRAAEAEGARQTVTVGGMNHVLWAGCRDNQTSAEANVNGKIRGIFTYCFCSTLRKVGLNVTRAKLDGLVSAAVGSMGYAQVPQTEGSAESLGQKVFT